MSFKKLVEKCYPVHDLPALQLIIWCRICCCLNFNSYSITQRQVWTILQHKAQKHLCSSSDIKWWSLWKAPQQMSSQIHTKKMHFCQTSLNISKSQHGGKWKNKIKVSAARVLSLHKVKQTRNKAQSVFVCVFLCERILHRVDRLDVSCSVSRSKQHGWTPSHRHTHAHTVQYENTYAYIQLKDRCAYKYTIDFVHTVLHYLCKWKITAVHLEESNVAEHIALSPGYYGTIHQGKERQAGWEWNTDRDRSKTMFYRTGKQRSKGDGLQYEYKERNEERSWKSSH